MKRWKGPATNNGFKYMYNAYKILSMKIASPMESLLLFYL